MRLHKSHEAFTIYTVTSMIFLLIKTESTIITDNPPISSTLSTEQLVWDIDPRLKLSTAFSHLHASSSNKSFAKAPINATPKSDATSNKAPNNFYPAEPQPLPELAKKIQKFGASNWISRASQKLSHLLSSDTLSNPDLFQYFIRETSKLSNSYTFELSIEIDNRLERNQIPESLIPYARALRSIMTAQINLLSSKEYIKKFQNDLDRFSVPSEISSPPELSASGLFSSDVFSDSDAPIQLLNALIRIPKNDIPNVISQLENYTKIMDEWVKYIPPAMWRYMSYARNLISILQSNSILDNLKRDMVEIQRTTTSR